MRFNSRELSCLARQTSDRFDKEGILFAKERQEGIFRKSEGLPLLLFFTVIIHVNTAAAVSRTES